MPTSIARPPNVVTSSACSAGRPAGAVGRVVADQQVGEDRGQLPEDVEQQQVVGDDQAEHRAGERDEVARERGQARLVVGEVPARSRPAPARRCRRRPAPSPTAATPARRPGQVQRGHPADHLGLHQGVGHRARPHQRPATAVAGTSARTRKAACRGADQGGRHDGGHEVREHQGKHEDVPPAVVAEWAWTQPMARPDGCWWPPATRQVFGSAPRSRSSWRGWWAACPSARDPGCCDPQVARQFG